MPAEEMAVSARTVHYEVTTVKVHKRFRPFKTKKKEEVNIVEGKKKRGMNGQLTGTFVWCMKQGHFVGSSLGFALSSFSYKQYTS